MCKQCQISLQVPKGLLNITYGKGSTTRAEMLVALHGLFCEVERHLTLYIEKGDDIV